MGDKEKRELNEAIATGRCYVNYRPLDVLKELDANVSYSPALGFVIVLGKDHGAYLMKRLRDCIAFNEGRR